MKVNVQAVNFNVDRKLVDFINTRLEKLQQYYDKIVGIDARGFVFGSAVAYELGVGFVPIRKRGKLPYRTEIAKYSLEYGEAEVEMHIDAVTEGERVVLVDDLLATGGTSAAAAALLRNAGANLIEAQFLIELEFLEGRKRLEPTPITAFLKY